MRRTLGISFATIAVVAFACDEFSEGDVPVDAGAGETSTTTDASGDDGGGPISDASDAQVDATPPAFCSTVDASTSLCWSFDDPSVSALYGTTFTSKGEPVRLLQNSPKARSAPNAMVAERDGAAGSGPSVITMNVPNAKNALACTIAVFIEDISNPTELLTFGLGARKAAFLVEPQDQTSVKTALLYDRTGPKTVAGPNIPKGKWITITLAGQRTGANAFVLATTNELADGGLTTASFADAGENIFAETPSVDIGFYVQYGGAGGVRVDDILCDWN